MVVLAITANAHPVVQWFSSIITLMMDVTVVSLLRQLTAGVITVAFSMIAQHRVVVIKSYRIFPVISLGL